MILQLVFQIILLSWPMTARSTQAQALAKPNCQTKCGKVTIPFPFGIGAGCYIDDWFEIDCDSSKPFIRSMHLEVLEISLEGTIRVNHRVLTYCNESDYSAIPYGNLLADSPFVFSQRSNRFTGIGCNNIAYMSTDDSVLGGCLSICDNNTKTLGENSCYGIECCQTRIPSYLKVFNATISNINYENVTQEGCKYAFLVDQHWFETNLKNPQDVEKITHVPVVLDWGIFKSSFDRFAKNKPNGFKSNSDCKESAIRTSSSTQFPIVHCSCHSGYQGNPYILQGCQDIDECNPRNTCGGMICQNFIGGYGCFTKKYKINMVVLGLSTGLGSFFLLIGAWWLCIILKRRKATKLKQKFFKQNGGLLLQQQLTSSDGSVDRSKLFNSKELEIATDNFNVNRILGQGGQGTVYKGMLSDGRIVAVKKSKVVDERKVHDFINEVVILSQINHRNVVKLLGCCLETKVPLLVYEFIPNGTLSQYLHQQNEELPIIWDMRIRIATEVARAFSYLHSAASLPIYHRDIKSTNILLDEKYRAKVADFGTSRSIDIDQTHVTTKVQGTFGYLDPEYFQTGQFTDKSDVYSFGVVLIELLTGQKPIFLTRSSKEGKSLVAYFIISMEENSLYKILDAQVLKQGNKEEIMTIANLAIRCLNLNGKKRPTMKEVAMELEGIQASQNVNSVQQPYQEIEYERTEILEAWDVRSSSVTTLNNVGSSVNVQPMSTNTSK